MQLDFVLLLHMLVHHQALKKELPQAIKEKNVTLHRYLRNRYLRRETRRTLEHAILLPSNAFSSPRSEKFCLHENFKPV